jgi:succinyl-CoA synthetase beta subunit
MRVLEWITSRPSLRAVLVNIFAGITDLAEFGALLATAMEQTPSLHVPVVARLVGRSAADARRILAERRPDLFVTEDLEEALRRIDDVLVLPPRAGGGRGRGADTATSPQSSPARGAGA